LRKSFENWQKNDKFPRGFANLSSPNRSAKMGGRGGGGGKVQKVMVQPINLIFRYLQNKSRIQVWLYENVNNRIEGFIVGELSFMPIYANFVQVSTST
jgi:hypothetical protein